VPPDLVGRTAIVTGGARGIGESIVQRLAEAGCNVVINYNRSVDAAEALAETVRAGGRGAEVVAGSIADPATGPALAACALEHFGQIDILVNNAGINRDVTIRKMTDEDFTEVIDTNLTGTHRVTKAVIEPMCAAGFGRIISISSFVGQLKTMASPTTQRPRAG
jgi:NAD(P)-dependent dehydrogenase (short-subunit alcohol dehydrogenase family)